MKKRRIKWDNVIVFLILVISIIFLIIKVINIIKWQIESNNTNKQISDIENIVEIEEADDSDSEIIDPEIDISKENPYWTYIKMNMIDVDLSDLKKINKDVKGWIKVNGTNINYPFVQYKDNKYYLTHSFNKTYNKAGWVFLDYRNNSTSNRNTIIYAHGRTDKTMFGSLKNILSSGWLDDSNNYVIKISTPKENTLWQVFSVYHIVTTSDYLQTEFLSNDNFLEFVNMLKKRSAYDFDTTVSKNDNILTLSTCYNSKEKLVLHAKLIKRKTR